VSLSSSQTGLEAGLTLQQQRRSGQDEARLGGRSRVGGGGGGNGGNDRQGQGGTRGNRPNGQAVQRMKWVVPSRAQHGPTTVIDDLAYAPLRRLEIEKAPNSDQASKTAESADSDLAEFVVIDETPNGVSQDAAEEWTLIGFGDEFRT